MSITRRSSSSSGGSSSCSTIIMWVVMGLVLCYSTTTTAFSINTITTSSRLEQARRVQNTSTTCFYTPRRNLPKRNKRNRRVPDTTNDFFWEDDDGTTERRPLVKSRIIEKGFDYWMDEDELRRSLEHEQAIKNRKAQEGEIPKEKLIQEVVAPYKQNWIGYFSMMIVMIATIGTKFPELLNHPVIPIPDL